MARHKILVFSTVFIAALTLILLGLYHHFRAPLVTFHTKGQPFLGSMQAQQEFVLFEDLRCVNCKNFHQKIFPKIKEKYIDSKKARLVLILLSFLPGSQEVANAALAVWEDAPDRFFPYVDACFSKEPKGKEALLEIASEVGGICLEFLQQAIEKKSFSHQLSENYMEAKKAMPKGVGTPALYLNGKKISTGSFEKIEANWKEDA